MFRSRMARLISVAGYPEEFFSAMPNIEEQGTFCFIDSIRKYFDLESTECVVLSIVIMYFHNSQDTALRQTCFRSYIVLTMYFF